MRLRHTCAHRKGTLLVTHLRFEDLESPEDLSVVAEAFLGIVRCVLCAEYNK